MDSPHLQSSEAQVEIDSTGPPDNSTSPPDTQDPQLTLRLLTDAITRLTALAATPQISSDGGFSKLVESNDVPKFKGNTKDHRRFLTKLNMVFALSPATFSPDEKKILFAGKRMEGAAEEWFDGVMLVSLLPDITDPAVVDAKAVMTNWDSFIDAFRIFEDPQLQQHLEDELDALKQTGSAANYAASFRAIAYQLPINDYTRASRFYKGLKDDVKDRICEEGRAATFDLLVMQAAGIDSRLFARRQEQRRTNNNSKPSFTSTTNTLNQTQANKNGYIPKTVSTQSQGNRQNPISPPLRPHLSVPLLSLSFPPPRLKTSQWTSMLLELQSKPTEKQTICASTVVDHIGSMLALPSLPVSMLL